MKFLHPTFYSVLFLAVILSTCAAVDDKVKLQDNMNSLMIRNMRQQMKTMESGLKLIEASCGKRRSRRDTVVAFHAKLKSTIRNVKQASKIKFENVVLNEGNAYNNQTGVFTSPIDGIYVFEWTFLTHPGEFHLDFMVNGRSEALTNNKQTYSNSHSSISNSVVVKLKKGDQTWLEPHSGEIGQNAHGNGWTYFSGFKL